MSPEDSGYLRTCFQAQVIVLKGETVPEVPNARLTIMHADTERSAFVMFSIVSWLMPQFLMFK